MKYNVSWNTEVKHSVDNVWNDSDNSHCFVTAKALDGSLSSKLEGLGTVWGKTFMSQSKLLTELLVTIFSFWRSKQRFHTGLHCNWASGKKKKRPNTLLSSPVPSSWVQWKHSQTPSPYDVSPVTYHLLSHISF